MTLRGVAMTQALDSIKIEGLRQFESLTLEELGPVNIVFGDNNSGKSTFLEALALLSDPLNPLVWIQASQRQVSWRTPFVARPRLEMIRWLFRQTRNEDYQQPASHALRISVQGAAPIKEVSATLTDMEEVAFESFRESASTYNDSASDEAPVEPNDLREGVEIAVTVRQESNQLSLLVESQESSYVSNRMEFWEGKIRIKPDQRRPKLDYAAIPPPTQVSDELALSLSQATREGFKSKVIDLVRMVDPEIIDIQVLPTRPMPQGVYIEHSTLGLVPVYAFGDGLRRILAIALSLPRAQNGLLLIDEIETAIHASLLQETFAWLVKSCKVMNVQAFATTHSIEALDAMLAATQDNSDIVGFGLRDKGRRVQRYSEDLLSRLRFEHGLDPR
jgi:AAA15 family ATPase/GTPase